MFTRQINGVLGGMERQILKVSEFLASGGHQVTILSLDLDAPVAFYKFRNDRVEFINIGTSDPSFSSNFLGRVARQVAVFKALKRVKPDVAICFMFGAFLYSRIPTLISRIPLILSERNSPEMYNVTSAKRHKWIIFFLMYFTNSITVQFPRYLDKYPRFLRTKIVVIPNSVVIPKGKFEKKSSQAKFVFAGRFSHQKQVLRLVEAFNSHRKLFPGSKLSLFGSGEEESKIRQFITSLNLEEHVVVRGPVQEISDALGDGNVLCVPSIWEGFPNVLAEALSIGMPALGFSNCDGVVDLIVDGENGWLEFDNQTLDPLVRLLNRAATSINKGEDMTLACKESIACYTESKICDLWNSLVKLEARD
jgi:GalNAc-alpha-(1->4)-GalNAc-alpha-(1->3)-diNAcBac-PP-undecaprenol alpha-1,4-N-acetyl-D-galactosaminyltransferase